MQSINDFHNLNIKKDIHNIWLMFMYIGDLYKWIKYEQVQKREKN